MRNKEQHQRQISKIKNCKDPISAVSELADVVFEIGKDNCEFIQEVANEVMKIKKALFGNGDIEQSLLHRVSEIEDTVAQVHIQVKEINDNLVGTPSKIGKLADCERRFRSLEDVKDNINKFTWIVVSAFVVQFVTAIIAVIVLINK